MTDDSRRRGDETDGSDDWGTDFGSEFGRVQFADDETSEPAIRFSDDPSGTGPLPHWTEGTAETSRVSRRDEPDVWDTFGGTPPASRRPERLVIGTDPTGDRLGRPGGIMGDTTGDVGDAFDLDGDDGFPPQSEQTYDITGPRPRPRSASSRRGGGGARGKSMGRDMPAAVTTGLVMMAAFVGAVMWRPAAVMAIVVVALGLAAIEFFGKVTEKGYRPATFAGIAASVFGPLAAYWQQETGLLLVVVLGFVAVTAGFIGAGSVQSGPMPNTAVSMLAVVWIAIMGSYAALILSLSVNDLLPSWVGTDTIFIVVCGVVANDVGALVVGSSMGRTPLREWISPNKTIEGMVGGFVTTGVVLMIVGTQNGTWDTSGELLMLTVVISLFAPVGDLVESMFKRNLDIKDFGSVIAGHGGVLDRFDGFLFVLPAVYYLTLITEPWLP